MTNGLPCETINLIHLKEKAMTGHPISKIKQSSTRPSLRTSLLFAGIAGLIVLLLLIFRAIAFQNPAVADFYSRHIFELLASIWTWPISLLPFSVTEAFVVIGPFILIGLFVYSIIRLVKTHEHRGRRILRVCLWVLGVVFILLSLFLLFHGFNYARSPLQQAMDLPVGRYSVDELEDAVRLLGKAASQVREPLREDESGVLVIHSLPSLWREAESGWDAASSHYPALQSRVRAKPKGVLLSRYWSYTNIVGLYMPLLVEPNVHIDQPDFMIPVTAAHEMAHARGFAREGDCDFAAVLSCIYHPDPVWQYSGLISSWKSVARKLWEEDSSRYYQVYRESLSPAVIRDLEAESNYWKAFDTPIAQLSETINDQYLKANRDEEGVKSYGGVVDLLLAWLGTEEALQLFQ